MSAEQNVPDVQSHQGPPPDQKAAGRQGNESAERAGSDRQSSDHQDSDFSGGSVPHGMGQSKSSRRRRRKRKNKGPDAAPGSDIPQTQGTSGSAPSDSGPAVISSMQASAPQQINAGVSNPGQTHGGHHGGNGAVGAKRWKKKFRDRDRDRPRRDDNPGNQTPASSSPHVGSSNGSGGSSNGSGGFSNRSGPADSHQFGNRVEGWKSRKGGGGGGGKQGRDRGPRSFVGPMDHSYRVVNGNFADTPPSTIEHGGNHGGGGRPRSYHTSNDSQPIDYSQGRIVPVAEDAPTRIYFFIDDLFFIAKIQETARKLGVKVAFVKNEKEELARLTGGEEADRPALIVFDLNNANAKPLTLIPKLKAKLKRSTSIVGFLSHLQGDLKAKAVEAGCDTVMPRAAFSQNLPNLLRRYGLEEEKEEANFNQ